MSQLPWHRVFHPLCGADPLTLARLVRRHGPPGPRGWAAFGVAAATSLVRLPFTALEALLDLGGAPPLPPPVAIVGFPRSGTTHLHNLLAATGAFATVPPVRAALPWEGRTLGPALKPFVDPFLPRTRLIDGVAFGGEAPTEDEVGLANLGPGSYFHAIYFPRDLARTYREGLLEAGPARRRAVGRYVRAMGRGRGRPLLLKNPAYTAQVGALAALLPGLRVVHIHRDPVAVFASARRALARTLEALALQPWREEEVEAAVLGAYPAVMARLREEAGLLPPGRFAELAYEDLARDPMAALEAVREALGLDIDLGRARAHLAQVAGFRPEGGALDAPDRARVEAAWGPDIARYGRLSAA